MTTRALQIDVLLTPVIDYRDGSVASGYSVYFYSAGTSTAKNVWTEKEKTNPYTSRTLGSNGTVQVYGDGIYKIVIKDTDGTTVYEWDNVKIQSPNIAVLSKSGTYTATVDDDYIIIGATMTLNLFAAASFTHPICVKLNGSYTLTIDPNGSELIEGASTYTVDTDGAAVWLFSNGSAWFVANDTAISSIDAINLVAAIGGDAKLTAKSATIDIEDNNQYLRQKNAADDDYINLVKINDSDQVELGAVVKLIELLNLGLTIQDTGGDHTLTIKCNENLTADKVLSLVVNDGARAIDLSGNLTVSDAVTIASTDIFPAGTVMAFGQSSAPTGWTRLGEGDTIYDSGDDNAMFCFAKTGDIAMGGSATPKTGHTHTYDDVISHTHTYNVGGGDEHQAPSDTGFTYRTSSSGNTGDASGGVAEGTTAANANPYYVDLILAKKD